MNQQCKVCGEPAAGFHFGAFTCEGCKSFFGRSYNNLSSISECKNNGECVINKKNRTSCKACRLRKCLLVGMSKSGSRYGRRSNWFKIHCLLQEQQQQAAAAANQHQQMQRQKTPPPTQPALTGLNHHHASLQLAVAFSQQQALGRTTKEDLMMLGLDDYKNSTSPSISSPESHNSDSSVEVSDARLASRGLFKTVSSSEPQPPRDITFPIPFSHFPMFPQGFPALAAFPQHAQMPNSFLFPTGYLYPPPPTKPTVSPTFLKQPRYPTNINNINNNKNNSPRDPADMFNKRFYLDAILQSQRSPSTSQEERDDVSCTSRTPSPEIIQDNPIDLSMKRTSQTNISSEESCKKIQNMSGDEGTDRDEDLDEDITVDEDISSADEGCVQVPKVRTTPIDLTTRA